MKERYSYFFTLIYAGIFILSLITDWYAVLTIVLLASIILSFLMKLGKGLVLRELICLHGCILCLLMPLVGYGWYSTDNYLARILYFYMMVPADIYFPYALPAISGFVVILCLPFGKAGFNDSGLFISDYIRRSTIFFRQYPHLGLKIVIIGLVAALITPFFPSSLSFVLTMLYFSSYAGILYIYFNRSLVYRKPIIAIFILFVLGRALGGMFTEVAYMSITVFSFVFFGARASLFKKVLVFLLGCFSIILLQSVKSVYRVKVWKEGFSGNRSVLLGKLLYNNATEFSSLFDVNSFFPIYIRFNQGQNVSRVMKRVPSQHDFDNGRFLLANVTGSVVPRIFWADKPNAGGVENMKYYAGFAIKGWSTNVGPLGEVYASFGVVGGIAFMMFLGFLIRWVYEKIFQISKRVPLLLFWMPLLFYQVTSFMETDTTTLINALLKGAIFLWLFIKVFPLWFGITPVSMSINRNKETTLI